MRIHPILGGLALTLVLAACGSSASTVTRSQSSSSAAGSGSSAPAAVAIKGFAFASTTITVKPGTRITFTNHDQTAHTATASGHAFDTGTINPGASRSIVVGTPGRYTYYCQFHAFMRGTVVVK